jgi:hypothetical protein
MTSRVFVHIGAPTSGSAFLRDTLNRHRRRLTRVGVLYPASHFGHDGGQLDAVLDVLNLATSDHAPAQGAWDRLADTVRDWRRGTVVVSHELLVDAGPAQVERIVSSFGGVEVHVVYAARTLGRQIPSAWQQWVLSGGTAAYPAYLTRIVSRDEHRVSRVFWRSHDVGDVLRRWGAAVPPDRLHVVTVPDGVDQDAVLWSRFARLVGVDPHRFRAGRDEHGFRGLAEIEVLRLLNVEQRRRAGGAGAARVHSLLPARGEGLPFPAEHAAWLTAETARMVADVEAGGYDVVGDLAELLTAPGVIAPADMPVAPCDADVVHAQTRLIAALAGADRDAKGPAGLGRRVLPGASLRLPRVRRR